MKRKSAVPAKILVVDDDEKILFAFEEVLRREGFKCLKAQSGAEALRVVAEQQPALVFMDVAMPHLDGLETLRRIRELTDSTLVIIITGHGTMQTAIRATQLGAFDYLTKPLDVSKIRETIRKALESKTRTSIAPNQITRFKADIIDRYELVGNTRAMQEVYKLIGSVAMTPPQTSVLITGESGTGKELVARAIHGSSSTSLEPFVAINCTALPESLLESELFGHEKGAFTGAFERRVGKFESARHGTIFLDEIGSLTTALQQKLLRALQEREYEPLGGNDRLSIHARFIAATNIDLAKGVQQGSFRKDLFFRLNVVAIHLPPLRERKDDIPLLADYFLKKYGSRIKKHVLGFSEEALDVLKSYSFPGNVRELENIVERAVIFSKGEVILPHDLKETMQANRPAKGELPIISPVFSKSRINVLKIFERQFIEERLKKHRGNVTNASKESKMTRQNFQRLMKKYKIKSDRFR